MDVDQVEETLTNPDTRIIKQITVDDIDATDELFNDLMGTAVGPRKDFIRENSYKATYEV